MSKRRDPLRTVISTDADLSPVQAAELADRVAYRHASFFSGIGAFDLGFERAGFRVVSHAEVKPYSCAVLETHWPGVPNLGDINAICPDGEGDHECEIPEAEVWSGGFPCSDFSVMGKRKGLLGGRRSSLGLVFLDLVRRHRPPFVVLENVPGLLTSHEGRDLGLLLGTLVDIGYGWSYRLLDARNFGLPQARRRVFVVAAADPRDAGAVLDDTTYRRVDAEAFGGPGGAALAGGGGGAAEHHTFVLGPTYAPESANAVRSDGTAFPILPSNSQYVLDGPVVIRREGTFDPQFRRDGSAFTILPGGTGGRSNIGQQFVVEDEPVVIKRKGYDFGSDLRADGAAFTVQPRVPGRDDQYVVEDETIVLERYGTIETRQRRGTTPTLVPPGGNTGRLYVVVDDEWDDLDVGRGDGLGRDDGDGRGPDRAVGRGAGAPAGPDRAHPLDGAAPDGPGPEDHADGVRATSGSPGRVDDSVGRGALDLGPVHLDTARWHVLGRTCPVPIVEWIGEGLRTVLDAKRTDARGDDVATASVSSTPAYGDVVEAGEEPVVLAGVFTKRREQRSPSRRDGVSYTLTPGVIPYIIEPATDDWPDDVD